MKKSLLVLLASTGLMFGSSAFAETKIGVVDFNKALLESPQLADAKNKLKKQFDAREKEIAEAQKKFQASIEAFNKNSPTMKADAKEAEQRKIMEQQKKVQEMQEKFQKDVNETQTKVMNGIVDKIQSIVDKVANDNKLDLIIVKASAPYSKKELEVTDAVIKQLKGSKDDVAKEVVKKADDIATKIDDLKKKVDSK